MGCNVLVHVLSLLDLWNRKTVQRVEVRGRWGLYRLDDLLHLGRGPLQVLIISGVVFAEFLDPTKRLNICHEFFGLHGVLHPVYEVFHANDVDGIVDVWVPVGLEARTKQKLPTVIEDHEPRVPQTGPLYVLRVGCKQHPAESESRRRSSFSCPGLIVKYADSSVTTPWLAPLPDFVVTWPVVSFCFLLIFEQKSTLIFIVTAFLISVI